MPILRKGLNKAHVDVAHHSKVLRESNAARDAGRDEIIRALRDPKIDIHQYKQIHERKMSEVHENGSKASVAKLELAEAKGRLSRARALRKLPIIAQIRMFVASGKRTPKQVDRIWLAGRRKVKK